MRKTFMRGEHGGATTVDLVSTEELRHTQAKARFWQAMYLLGLVIYLFTFSLVWDRPAMTDQQLLARLIDGTNCSYVPAGVSSHEIAGKE